MKPAATALLALCLVAGCGAAYAQTAPNVRPGETDNSADYVGEFTYVGMHPELAGDDDCGGTWSLRPDGTMTMASGELVVEARWSIVRDWDNLSWMLIWDQRPNGAADCTGHVRPDGLPSHRDHIITWQDGSFTATLPPQRVADGGWLHKTPLYRLQRTTPRKDRDEP